MTLFLLVKPSNTLDRHVVGFGCARSENDIFGVSTNKIGDVLFENKYVGISRCGYDGFNVPS